MSERIVLNGRVSVASPSARVFGEARHGEAKTLGEEAYWQLRRDILSGRLSPGEKLPFRRLGERYDFGIAPLREALSKLASERLVAFEGQRGFAVAPVSLEELRDICSLRIELSVAALQLSIRRGDADWEADIVAALHRLLRTPLPASPSDEDAIEDWERRHERFHDSLIAACGSPWRLHFCSTLSDQFERYRRLILLHMAKTEDVAHRVDEEHRGIAEATINRDEAEASRRLAEHFEGSLTYFIAHFHLSARGPERGEAVGASVTAGLPTV